MVNYDDSILNGHPGLTHCDAMDLVYAATQALLDFVAASKSSEGERLSNALQIALHLLYKTNEDE